MYVLVMGVTGSGKTTVGALLAGRLGLPFLDADDYHPPANVAKLSAGIPLEDADRWPWLEAAHRAWTDAGGGVLACSALKQAYRDVLLRGLRSPVVVYLHGTPELIAARLAARHGHFASPGILSSQFEALEEPAGAIRIDIGAPANAIAAAVVSQLPRTS